VGTDPRPPYYFPNGEAALPCRYYCNHNQITTVELRFDFLAVVVPLGGTTRTWNKGRYRSTVAAADVTKATHDLEAELTKHFGFTSFTPGQEQVISAIISGRDTLAVLPTGGIIMPFVFFSLLCCCPTLHSGCRRQVAVLPAAERVAHFGRRHCGLPSDRVDEGESLVLPLSFCFSFHLRFVA
jgi:hypothetical protein